MSLYCRGERFMSLVSVSSFTMYIIVGKDTDRADH